MSTALLQATAKTTNQKPRTAHTTPHPSLVSIIYKKLKISQANTEEESLVVELVVDRVDIAKDPLLSSHSPTRTVRSGRSPPISPLCELVDSIPYHEILAGQVGEGFFFIVGGEVVD